MSSVIGLYKTPLRYPGGKQRLWKFIDEVLVANDLVGADYVEPYCGGAGVAIELLLRNRVETIHLNDSCPAVYAFWTTIKSDADWLCSKISRASLTVDEWKRQREVFKNRKTADRFDLAFAMFYLNRANRSGILTGGIIGGLDQTGKWKMDARFSRNDLINRIEAIASRGRDIRVRNWDAERYLTSYVPKLPKRTLVYCDPPYFKKADRLYPNYYAPNHHASLSKIIQNKVNHPWLVSYDACVEIEKLYSKRTKFIYQLQYNAASAYKGSELFITSDKITIPSTSCIPAIDDVLKEYWPIHSHA